MVTLKIPDETTADNKGWILHTKDGKERTFVGTMPFDWNWNNLEIYTAENRSYVFLIKDVARLEKVIFNDNQEKVAITETFCFE